MIADLHRAVDVALAARARRGTRPVRGTAGALAAAAAAWRDDPTLAEPLAGAAHLDRSMVDAVRPLIAEPLDADALAALHAREAAPAGGPALVAHVLASNVPGLAVPAIALGCLAGAAVLVKSGRDDALSAPAFHRALAAVDAELAATVVTAYWRGGASDGEDALLARADVVVASGGDAAMAELVRRLGPRVRAHGSRTSIAVVRDDVDDRRLAALATDVVLYEQRGCLSPTAVFVLGDPHHLAERLHGALAEEARRLPPAARTTAERAALRLALEEARFAGDTVLEGAWGNVVVGARRPASEPVGMRTVHVHALRTAAALAEVFQPGTVECVGAADVGLDVAALRRRGVSRVCPLGRMQRPRIDWPRGQRPALGALFHAGGERRIQVEA